jgi:hypothetical protein
VFVIMVSTEQIVIGEGEINTGERKWAFSTASYLWSVVSDGRIRSERRQLGSLFFLVYIGYVSSSSYKYCFPSSVWYFKTDT